MQVQTTAKTEIKNCLTMAARVGCEPDQMARFLQAGYVPLPRGLEFHAAAREADQPDGPDLIGYGGARGEAKSHAVIAQVGLDDCQRLPGAKWLYLRKIQKSAGEQLEDLISKTFFMVPHRYLAHAGVVKFDNGSKIMIGGYRSENEIDAYIGLEYDGIVIEDATVLSDSKVRKIRGSLRSSKPGWRPRMYLPANPGGVGHGWYKKLLVDPYQQKRQTVTRFVHAQRGDNPFINDAYRKYLDTLTGWLRRAWRDGDFSIAAGQFFTTFNPEVHVYEPFKMARNEYIWWGALDYGFVHWNVTYLLARLGENIYIVDEHAARRQYVKQNAGEIKEMLGRYGLGVGNLRALVAGPDVFAERGTEETIAQQYERQGLKLTPAKTDRVNGAARVRDLLGNPKPYEGEDYQPARLFISTRCHRLIETLLEMLHDPARGEDVLKVDCDPETGEGGDDPYDAARYGLMAAWAPPTEIWNYSEQRRGRHRR